MSVSTSNVSTSNVQGLETQECLDVACLSESVQLLASSVVSALIGLLLVSTVPQWPDHNAVLRYGGV